MQCLNIDATWRGKRGLYPFFSILLEGGIRIKMMRQIILGSFLALGAAAQSLPDGPGRKELEVKCKQCHELARSISLRQDRDGWSTTMTKMAAFGMKGTDEEFKLIVDYLAKHYPA